MTPPTPSGTTVSAPAPPAPRRPRGLGIWLKIGFLVLAATAGVWYIAAHWGETGPALSEIGWGAALGSVPLVVGAGVAGMLAWRRLLADLGHPLPVIPAARVFYSSQLGKYLPGSVWTFVAQVELAKFLRVPRAVSFAVSVLAVVLSLAVGLSMAVILLPFGAGDALRQYWWLWLILPVLVAAIHPAVTTRGINLLFRTFRRPPIAVRPTGRGMLAATGWQILSWCLMGLHCFVLVRAAGAEGWTVLPLAVGGFTLAYCAGLLFVPAPAGFGVRELALGAALATVISPQSAAAVVLVSRLVLAAVDLGMATLSIHKPKHPEEEGT
ncbi:lysylphosphatidylglycerol synthase transmembrane domain-containing protein [Phytohabitans flavus]|uniref:Membrane protein n=1 Tax=Phytohabitans flavus TaxID=1076124 RepID=A0A6F8XU03_9ACTN|nr:lysylphosphatidylglycerol synthase domain-containing protein [Phytohabitans flavus]BCB77314.1 membrane protein [Phytohabitans flavus]